MNYFIFAPIIATLLMWLTWDILVWTGVLKQSTVSSQMKLLASEYPIIPFALGIVSGALAGHFFWNIQ